MKRLVLACLLALALASPAAARPSSVRSSRLAVSSWLSRAWNGVLHVIGSFRLFDGDTGSHTLPPPQSTTLSIGG